MVTSLILIKIINLLTAASPLALPQIYQVTHFISLSLRHDPSP